MSKQTDISKNLLDELLAGSAEGKTVPIIASEWFTDPSKHKQAKAKLKEYEPVFESSIPQVTKLIGPPESDNVVDGFEIEKWFPEALKAKIWIRNSKVLCLALVQYDSDAPVGVILRSLKVAEMKDLADW